LDGLRPLLYPFKIFDQILFLLIAEVEFELRVVVLNHVALPTEMHNFLVELVAEP